MRALLLNVSILLQYQCFTVMIHRNVFYRLKADRPELLPEFLCQLIHDGVTVILNSFEGGQVAVLLQHTSGMAVGLYCLSVGLQLQTFV